MPDAAIAPHVIQLAGRVQRPSESAGFEIQAVKERNMEEQEDGASPSPYPRELTGVA